MKQSYDYSRWLEVLINNSVFKEMSKSELMHTLACLNPVICVYQANDMITIGGTLFNGVGIVLEGQVLVAKELISGQRHIMAKLSKQQLFGEMIAFSNQTVWPATVTAMTDCTIMFLPPNMILGTCTHACVGHNQLIRNMLEIISNKALKLNRKVEYLSIKGMREKLATFLLEAYNHHEGYDEVFDVALSREELAGFLNVSRPSMSRELARMKEDGLIDYYKSSFKIIDFERLSEIVS